MARGRSAYLGYGTAGTVGLLMRPVGLCPSPNSGQPILLRFGGFSNRFFRGRRLLRREAAQSGFERPTTRRLLRQVYLREGLAAGKPAFRRHFMFTTVDISPPSLTLLKTRDHPNSRHSSNNLRRIGFAGWARCPSRNILRLTWDRTPPPTVRSCARLEHPALAYQKVRQRAQ